MATRDWRKKTDYAAIEDFTRRELAWEYLRRNPDFKRDQRRIKKKTEPAAADAVAQTWGLRFRDGSKPRCEGSRGVLVAFRQRRRCRPDERARELHAPAA